MSEDFDMWPDKISLMKFNQLKKMEKFGPDKRNRVEFFKLQVECSLLNEIVRVRNSEVKKQK